MGNPRQIVAAADGTRTMVPGFKVPVVDSTAAGDAFNGGLAVALMQGMALPEAARFAAFPLVSVCRVLLNSNEFLYVD